jgi:hypothetical protein
MKNTLNNGSAVQASNSLGANGGILGAMVNQWGKAKNLQANVAVKKWQMDYSHTLEMDRIKHKTAMGLAADTAGAAIQHHYDTAMEGIKTSELDKRNTRQNDLDQQLEQAKHIGAKERIDLKTQGDIKVAQKTAAATRATKKHASVTDLNSMKALSSGLNENKADPSTGISPLVAGPNQLQNIGNALKGHPLLNFDANTGVKSNPKTKTPTNNVRKKAASNPPITPANEAPDAPSSPVSPVVEPAKQKPVTQPKRRGRTATVGGGLTEITPDSVKTGKRGSL